MTCVTSDFLHPDTDEYRFEAWKMMGERSDCYFYFFTKRIDRFEEVLPDDWNDGYDNVIVACTVENQRNADYRLPIFKKLPIKHKTIMIAPMIGPVNIEKYLGPDIEQVSCSGKSGDNVRSLDYAWVLDVRKQCIKYDVAFSFHQTGAYFIKDSRMYHIQRKYQRSQAKLADIDYKTDSDIPLAFEMENGFRK